ncbi:MAG: PIN domain-containing protein [Candidatus Tyrphobacter sp.]
MAADPVLLCDTNVVSILLKVGTVHDARKQRIRAELSGNIAAVSFVTVAELLYWAECHSWGAARKSELDRRLRSFAILDPTRATAEHWANIKNECRKSGDVVSENDLWIAAAAREYGIKLATADGAFDSVPGIATLSL